jgi:hypothetical protein
MKQVISPEGWRFLRVSWVSLALSVAASAGIVMGSHWYVAREGRERASAAQRLQDAQVRLQSALRERESLQQSSEVFRSLVDRGLLQAESRLDLVEMVNDLRTRHRLFALDYEIAPQRPLALPGGRAFTAVDVLASRVKLRIQSLHEGDVVAFVQALTSSPKGFFTLDRCAMRRIEVAEADALRPRVEADCAFEWITLKDKNANPSRPG